MTCIQKAGCPWLGLDQEDVRHEATRPVGTEKQKSGFGREKILEEVGNASAGTAKDTTLSGAADGRRVLRCFLRPHLLQCHGYNSFGSGQRISGETREGRCLRSAPCSDCATKANGLGPLLGWINLAPKPVAMHQFTPP